MLIANSSTDDIELDMWKLFFDRFNYSYEMWNISYYNGISFTSKLFGTRSLSDIYKDKIVLFLNNKTLDNDQPELHARAHDIFQSCKDNNVRFYFLGDHVDITKFNKDTLPPQIPKSSNETTLKEESNVKQFMKLFKSKFIDTSQKATDFNNLTENLLPKLSQIEISDEDFYFKVYKNYGCCSKPPSQNDLINFMIKCRDEVNKLYPELNIDLTFNYNITHISKYCCSQLKYLGYIIARVGISKDECRFISRSTDNLKFISNEDKFNIFKLLPFQEKINVLKVILIKNETTLIDSIKESILSDLVYEQEFYKEIYKSYKQKNFNEYFVKLVYFSNSQNYTELKDNSIFFIKEITLKVLSFLKNILTFSEKYCCCCSNTNYSITKKSERLLSQFYFSLFSSNQEKLDEDLLKYNLQLSALGKKKIGIKKSFLYKTKDCSDIIDYFENRAECLNISKYKNINISPISIIQNKFVFNSQEDRMKCVEVYENLVKYY